MLLALGFGFSVVMVLVAYAFYLLCQQPGIIDVFWGVNITGIALIYLSQDLSSRLNQINLLLVLIWGTRLSLFLYLTRIKKEVKEKRYEKLAQGKKNIKLFYFFQYLLQAPLAFIIALPFYFIHFNLYFSNVYLMAQAMVVVGLIGESSADYQLYQYAKNKKRPVCDSGLWRYSRHPNYFFECSIWLGFSLLGINNTISLLSLLSIITLFSIMWFITLPLTEKVSMEKRGKAYLYYMKKTPKFFPWFPK